MQAVPCSALAVSEAFLVADPTYPPAAPNSLRCVDKTQSSINLSWLAPLYDGGVTVDGYIVEYAEYDLAEIERGAELVYLRAHSGKYILTTEYIITGLKANKEYKMVKS